ncbi:MAG: hypothetical protein JWO05_2756 [Gemmatimonadetes bacterium]|nr:hypothetical protein [Gemmatimonadota bacterium]
MTAPREALPPRARLDWKLELLVRVGPWLIRALGATWRVSVRHGEHVKRLRAEHVPFAYALWHGQLLPLLWHERGFRTRILISEHKDGEIIARVAEGLGYATVRGSTSRGGSRALLALARELQQGNDIAVTPDGPRGPARTFAAGALVAAQRSGTPILPIAASADRAWRLRSWDQFMIPKPFARVTVAFGEPAYVEAAGAREAAEHAPRFQALLDATVAEAERA